MKDRMLEWRREQAVYERGNNNVNTLENYLYDDKPEAENKLQEELSHTMQPMGTTPVGSVFLVVCLKK